MPSRDLRDCFTSSSKWYLPATIDEELRNSRHVLKNLGFEILNSLEDIEDKGWVVVKPPNGWHVRIRDEWSDIREFWIFDNRGFAQLTLYIHPKWKTPHLQTIPVIVRWISKIFWL